MGLVKLIYAIIAIFVTRLHHTPSKANIWIAGKEVELASRSSRILVSSFSCCGPLATNRLKRAWFLPLTCWSGGRRRKVDRLITALYLSIDGNI